MALLRTRLTAALRAPVVAGALTALAFAAAFAFTTAAASVLAARFWPAGAAVGLWAPLEAAPAQALALGIGIALAQGFARLARRTWWIILAALSSAFLFAMVAAAPVELTPTARGDQPAPAGAAAPLLVFVRSGGLNASRLYVFQGADPADVDMEGFGGLAHAAVSQAALAHPTPETFAAIGHLLGHHRNGDTWSMSALLALLASGALAALGPGAAVLGRRFGAKSAFEAGESAALPALGLILWSVLPLERVAFNLFDQAINLRADAYALSLTHDKAGLCRWIVTREAHGALDPSSLEAALFDSHPPAALRIRRILAAPEPISRNGG